jgi:putative tricarboxylic transport membrane protein
VTVLQKRPLIINLFWILFSLVVIWESRRLDVGTLHAPGPGFLPFVAAGLLGGLAVIALLQSLKGGKASEEKTALFGRNLIRVILLTGTLVLYNLLLPVLGFLPGTFLLLLLLFRAMEPLPWRKVILASVFTLAAVYLLFVFLLGTQLPKGFLGV